MQLFGVDAVVVGVVAVIAAVVGFVVGVLVGKRRAQPGGNGAGRKPQAAQKSRERDRDRGEKPSGKSDGVEIYVGNLSYDVTEKDLTSYFGAYGKVLSVRLIENKFSGKSKGFGFVEMADRDEALAAIKAVEGKEYKGRKMIANEARSRSRN